MRWIGRPLCPRRGHHSPATGTHPYFDQAGSFENSQRIADTDPANGEAEPKFPLRWELVAGLKASIANRLANMSCDRLRDAGFSDTREKRYRHMGWQGSLITKGVEHACPPFRRPIEPQL